MMTSFLSGSTLQLFDAVTIPRRIAAAAKMYVRTDEEYIRAVHGLHFDVAALHDPFAQDYPEMEPGLNLTVTLLTRHKHHCGTVKNLLTGRVDNRSWLTLRAGLEHAGRHKWALCTCATLGAFDAGTW
jgi:hypothetical protein